MIQKNKKKLLSITIQVFMGLLLSTAAFGGDVRVIKEPVPNMVETRYLPLHQSGSIDEDLGDDRFLFSPKYFTADTQGYWYVYDDLQAKIFKFGKNLKVVTCFGSKGSGPGEFSGIGRTRPVYIKIGDDGHLYANDARAKKVLVFTTDGRFLKNYYYGPAGMLKLPVADKQGNLHVLTLNGQDQLSYVTPDNRLLYSVGNLKDVSRFLCFEPAYVREGNQKQQRYFLRLAAMEMNLIDLTGDGRILSYSQGDSTLMVMKGGTVLKRVKLWPKHALAIHKKNLPEYMDRKKGAYKNMFYNLFTDADDAGLFYLQLGKDEDKLMNCIYQFGLDGNLKKVFYIKYKEGDPFTLFRLKQNGRFLAVREEKIITYKEKI